MRRSILLLLFAAALTALSGCGQKGPLVMPTAKVVPAPAASTMHPATPAATPAMPNNDQPSPLDSY